MTDKRLSNRLLDLYEKLWQSIVQTISSSYAKTETLWEQYDPSTGQGQRNSHFTGWTSLIALMLGRINIPDITVVPRERKHHEYKEKSDL